MSPSTKPTRYAAQAWIRENLLLIATISGVIMGVVLGKTVGKHGWDPRGADVVRRSDWGLRETE